MKDFDLLTAFLSYNRESDTLMVHLVPRYPHLLNALEVAELRGITLEEVARLRRDIGLADRHRQRRVPRAEC